MKLYFERNNGERVFLAESSKEEDLNKVIQLKLKKHNYMSHYSRRWKNQAGETVIDVGSHTELFYIVETDEITICDCHDEATFFIQEDNILYCDTCRAVMNYSEKNMNDERVYSCHFCGEAYFYPEDKNSWCERHCCERCRCYECGKDPDNCNCSEEDE